MKISGKTIDALARGEVRLPRPEGNFITVKIKAFPLGSEGTGAKLFREPSPPVDFVKGKNGLPLRDPVTQKPLREPDYENEDYLEKAEEATRMQLIVMAIEAMDDVTFESTKPMKSREWYLDAYEEMKAAGFTFGDLRLILEEARGLSNLDGKKLEAAAESF